MILIAFFGLANLMITYHAPFLGAFLDDHPLCLMSAFGKNGRFPFETNFSKPLQVVHVHGTNALASMLYVGFLTVAPTSIRCTQSSACARCICASLLPIVLTWRSPLFSSLENVTLISVIYSLPLYRMTRSTRACKLRG